MLDPQDLQQLKLALRKIGEISKQNPLHVLPRLIYLVDRESFIQIYIEVRDNIP